MSVSGGTSTRSFSLSEISEVESLPLRISVDLVAAARRNISLLRLVADYQWLHHKPTLLEAIRRYDALWMPLQSDLSVGPNPPMIIPPLDIEWVWFCHTLNPIAYREYCWSRFSKSIGRPAIFDEENKEYALDRCREIWIRRYPSEPFENDPDASAENPVVTNDDLLEQAWKQRCLCPIFSEPYMTEVVYLIAAKQRYKKFLRLIHLFTDDCSVFVPTSDILLMWLTHQSYPTVYEVDVKEMEERLENAIVRGPESPVKEKEVEVTMKLWERAFDEAYEKAGGIVYRGGPVEGNLHVPPVYLAVGDADVNTKYKSLLPRFLLEVHVMVNKSLKIETSLQENMPHEFLRLGIVRCHRKLKIDKPILNVLSDSWQKVWHLYCEFGSKGIVLELRSQGGGHCFRGSTLRDSITFHWNDLLRASSLALEKEFDQKVRLMASITPPVQAAYLLKCVPDRVTDDSGAMVSDVILRMNRYRPQEGRWLSRTVLDHAGRECFVVRIRVGGGFWRRGGETPSSVKWEDRIIEVREGSWSYVAGTIGRAPEKVVGTATPKQPPEGWQCSWMFSTGDELLLRWETPTSMFSLNIDLINENSSESSVKLLKGRKMQYKAKKPFSKLREDNGVIKDDDILEYEDEEENDFVTVVRFSDDCPNGKATALLNWKLLVLEIQPEEDAILALLLCIAILRSISEMRKEDMGRLLMRRRIKEAKPGDRDWGSVVVHPSSSESKSSPYLQPWYLNAKGVIASEGMEQMTRQPNLNYSSAEGSDNLYKSSLIA